MIELKRRTPRERSAYLEGYAAGMRVSADAIARIAQVTAEAATTVEAQIALMFILGANSELNGGE